MIQFQQKRAQRTNTQTHARNTHNIAPQRDTKVAAGAASGPATGVAAALAVAVAAERGLLRTHVPCYV